MATARTATEGWKPGISYNELFKTPDFSSQLLSPEMQQNYSYNNYYSSYKCLTVQFFTLTQSDGWTKSVLLDTDGAGLIMLFNQQQQSSKEEEDSAKT